MSNPTEVVTIVVDNCPAVADAIAVAPENREVRFLRVDAEAHPRAIARAIAAAATARAVVLMNIDLLCARAYRHHQTGVEVLKFLRLMESAPDVPERARNIHCVMYSFRTLEALVRQKASSAVLCSKGVSFRQLPFDIAQLPIEALGVETAQLTEWRHILRGSIALPDDRHSWANWYAAWQMLRIHSFATGAIPGPEVDSLLPSDGQVERDALFAYGRPADLRAAAVSIHQRSADLRAQIAANLRVGPTRRGDTRPLKIGLIDDQAARIDSRTNLGWHEVHSRVLGIGRAALVDIWAEHQLSKASNDVDAVLAKLENGSIDLSDYSCILLDLRLARERGAVDDAERLSGTAVLSWLRSRSPTLPIIVTTASGRAGTFDTLMHLGADAYWIKRGIDEQATGADLAHGYADLLHLVNAATGPQYQFLRRLGQRLHRWQRVGLRWWDNPLNATWLSHQTPADSKRRNEAIDGIVADTWLMLRQYLHRHVMEYGYQRTVSAPLWTVSVIQHAGKALECIHALDLRPDYPSRALIGNVDTKDQNTGKPKWPDGHKDGFGSYLMAVRNGASHFGGAAFDWASLQTFLVHFACYVILGPRTQFRKGMNIPSGTGTERALKVGCELVALKADYRELSGELLP